MTNSNRQILYQLVKSKHSQNSTVHSGYVKFAGTQFCQFNLHEICAVSMHTLYYQVHTNNALREISSESI